MSRIDHALNPTDAESAVSSLDFDTNWLLEISNEHPEQVMPHVERIYSIMNRMQFIASRFARVCATPPAQAGREAIMDME